MPATSFTKFDERHYTAKEVAEMWRMDPSTVRKIFIKEEGVVLQGRQKGHRGKRAYRNHRYAASVVERVYRKMQSGRL